MTAAVDPITRDSRQIELRTLGSVDLRGPDGRPCTKLMSQSKRLAVLAYLAVEAPQRFHRRDTLVAMFWPELNHCHARNALSQTVFTIRRCLRKDAVLSIGREELRLNPAVIWCDASAFDTALSEGRLANALELYGGSFLEGLHASGAPDFDNWLEAKRARLRQRAASAAQKLAQEAYASHGLDEAVRWLRRASAIVPTEEPVIRRLMELLSQTGNRGAALQEYQRFANRLRRDHDIEPSEETRRLRDQVREDGPQGEKDP